MRAPYDMTGSSVHAVRKRNQRKYTAPQKLLSGHAMFYGISPSWPGEIAAAVILPIRTHTEGNSRSTWRMAQRRTDQQRLVTAAWLTQLGAADWRTQIVRVRFVRLGPGTLDQGGNLCSSFKHIRDQVAAWIAFDNTIKGRGDDGPKCGIYWDEDNQERSPLFGVRCEFFLKEPANG